MKLLLLDTCGPEGVVALAEDDAVIAQELLPGRGSSEHLLPAVRRLLTERGWQIGDLGAVAVVNGPGSFTGVRVGLSAAKGLCEGLGVPLIAISRLALIADSAKSGRETLALLDAGRGEYYGGVYSSTGAMLMEELFRRDQVEELLEGRAGIGCEARVAEAFSAVQMIAAPGAQEVLRLAWRRIAAGEWSDVALTDANYLRRTDAELLAKQAERTRR